MPNLSTLAYLFDVMEQPTVPLNCILVDFTLNYAVHHIQQSQHEHACCRFFFFSVIILERQCLKLL